MNEITQIQARSVLTQQSRHSSIPYDYTINPYRGCLFGCSYCYASRFVYDDADKKAEWGRWVEVKKNAVDALQRESHKLYDKTIFFSSATDPYQPIERKLGLTRALLNALLFAFPKRLHIQTRSPLVVRDIDLFQKFGDSLDVGISIPTDSDTVRKAFEPRAPSIPRRLEAARLLKEAGIRMVASVAPLLPCTPDRLALPLAPCVHSAWVDGINFYEKEDSVRRIFIERGWERYLEPGYVEGVKGTLRDAFGKGGS
ncbi:MAG: radical SAM protein [Armatimonadota bacterium]|nr:radical SAM protein [Armatimonadota bacterium]